MENVLKVLSYHGQIDAQISTNSCQIGPNDPQEHKEKLHRVITIFQKGNDHLAWYETISAATPLNCLAMTLLSNCPNLQKVGHDIVIFNGNVLGHAWHTWCTKCTNGKRMSCSLLICHTQNFKSIDFRTMGLWIWITFFLIRTVYDILTCVQSFMSLAKQYWLLAIADKDVGSL